MSSTWVPRRGLEKVNQATREWVIDCIGQEAALTSIRRIPGTGYSIVHHVSAYGARRATRSTPC